MHAPPLKCDRCEKSPPKVLTPYGFRGTCDRCLRVWTWLHSERRWVEEKYHGLHEDRLQPPLKDVTT